MTKLRLYMLGLLCAGLLLTGIGVGVTFTDFTGLRYGGEKIPETAQRMAQRFSVDIGGKTGPIYLEDYFINQQRLSDTLTFQTSETVASGKMDIHVSYDSIGPTVNVWLNGSEDTDDYFVNFSTNYWDEMAIVMHMKDCVLEDLKAGQLSSYVPMRLEEITITVNPADAARVQLPSSFVTQVRA